MSISAQDRLDMEQLIEALHGVLEAAPVRAEVQIAASQLVNAQLLAGYAFAHNTSVHHVSAVITRQLEQLLAAAGPVH